MCESAPVAQDAAREQLLSRRESEVCHGAGVKQEGHLSAVADVLEAEGQAVPDAAVTDHVVEDVHPHSAAHLGTVAGRLAGRAQEHIIGHDLGSADNKRNM